MHLPPSGSSEAKHIAIGAEGLPVSSITGVNEAGITFAVHQCARFMHKVKSVHKKAIKQIGQYLLGMRTNGIILDPSDNLCLDCYVDADFARM